MTAMRQTRGLGRLGKTALAASLALASVSAVSAQEVTLRASGHFPAGHTASIGMEIMNSELGRLTNGEMAIDYFPGSQLGGAFEGVDQVRTGQIDIDLGGPEWFGRVVPEVDVVNLPFLASGDKNAYCIIDSGLSAHLNAMSEKAGLVILGWMSNGARHVTNNERPIKSVDSVAGLKLRTPPSEIYLETFRALGAIRRRSTSRSSTRRSSRAWSTGRRTRTGTSWCASSTKCRSTSRTPVTSSRGDGW